MNIVKESLSEQIYKILKNDIINHKINFGEVIVNRNLQERFNVSSTPVRDALLRLKEDGIIDEITRSGAKIIDFNPKFARQVNEFIMIITLGAIEHSLNIENTSMFIENLLKYIDLQKKNIETNFYYEYDYYFHKTIFDFSKNPLLKELFKKYNLIN
ncbi:MAG: GntR family transcriptional regulator, partial [Fusobacterium sp.]|nr:GntR family transcriptional regulator [Fusobacterium sp.]